MAWLNPRKWAGWLAVATSFLLSTFAHRILHIGAWLLDQDEIMLECPCHK